MLERIGRSRQHGEVTVGKRSLNIELNISLKTALSCCLDLLKSNLITKQPMLMITSNRTVLGDLLHLPRFFCYKEQKLLELMRQLLQILKVGLL
jgi:hypothetical protein